MVDFDSLMAVFGLHKPEEVSIGLDKIRPCKLLVFPGFLLLWCELGQRDESVVSKHDVIIRGCFHRNKVPEEKGLRGKQ